MLAIAAALVLAGCGEPAEAPEPGKATATERAAPVFPIGEPEDSPPPTRAPDAGNQVSRQAGQAERQQIRIIGSDELTSPPPQRDGMKRLPPRESAEERNAREMARLPPKPDIFHRPLVVDAATIRSGDTIIHLAGIEARAADETCETAGETWPCGNFARAALQRLIRMRSLSCEGSWAEQTRFEGRCRIGKIDLSQWTVLQGWAVTEDAALEPFEQEARDAGRGYWRREAPGR